MTNARLLLRSSRTLVRPRAFSTEPPQFKYAKSQDLFERITAQCSREDLTLLGAQLNRILGRTFRPNEFYYKGFGGGRAKGGAAAEAAPVEEAKTTVDLKLAGFDAKAKIKVIKEVRSIAGLGLKEAKELVEAAPKVIQKGLKPEQAEELKAALEAVGAEIELV